MTPLHPSHAAVLSALHCAAFEAGGFRGWSIEECADMLEREEYFGWAVEEHAELSSRGSTAEPERSGDPRSESLNDSGSENRDPAIKSRDDAAAFLLLRRIDETECEIASLAVHPEHQRKGLAKQLVQHALAELRDHTIHLEVRETNAPARALYASLGFTETGTRPNYYKDGNGSRVAAVMMAYKKD